MEPFIYLVIYFLMLVGNISTLIVAFVEIENFTNQYPNEDDDTYSSDTALFLGLCVFILPFIIFICFNMYLLFRNNNLLVSHSFTSIIFLVSNMIILFFSIPILCASFALLAAQGQSKILGLIILLTSLISVVFTWYLIYRQKHTIKSKK